MAEPALAAVPEALRVGRRLLFILSMLATCTASASDDALEAQCAELTSRQTNQVELAIPELSVDAASSTTEDLAVMAGTFNGIDRQLGGITQAEPLISQETDGNLALLPDGKGVCARPSIRLKVGYASMGIVMDREIPRNSCIYNAIFAHEMHHVAIYKDYLTKNLDAIRQRVEEKFNGRTYVFKSIFAAKQYVEILGQVFAQHVAEKFLSEVYAEQHALDTQSEYTRMQNECYH